MIRNDGRIPMPEGHHLRPWTEIDVVQVSDDLVGEYPRVCATFAHGDGVPPDRGDPLIVGLDKGKITHVVYGLAV